MRRWMLAALLVCVVSLRAEPPKNLQVLTGMSRPEVQRVMNAMRAGLGVHCHYCHTNGDAAEDTKKEKVRAREMMRMVIDLNARHFGGRPVITCFTCHNGKPKPALAPPLPQAVPPDVGAPEPKTGLPTAASIVQKYVAAVGRELAPGTARVFQGTSKTPSGPPIPATIQSSGEWLRIDMQLPDGTKLTQSFDAETGWIRDKNGVRDIDAETMVRARMFRRAFAPFHTSSIGEDARVVDSEKIGERTAWVMAAKSARYWFDAETGLLLRRVISYDSPIGRIPEQTDFDDYRSVNGMKLPFMVRSALVDPWSGGTQQAETIETGVAIAPDEFRKPTPSPSPGSPSGPR